MTSRVLWVAAWLLVSSACLVPVTVGQDDGGSGGGSAGGSGGSGGAGGSGGCTGCFDALGVCQAGTTMAACGTGGSLCAACLTQQVCSAGACVHAPNGCTFGQDFTCNDILAMSSLAGQCLADGTCACHAGMEVNPTTGRCRPSAFNHTVCEPQDCGSGFQEADGGSVLGWCGTQSMGPGCTCAFDASTNDYHPLCTGGCLPDAGAMCVTLNCGTANCMNTSGPTLLATSCVGWGQCEYTGVPAVTTPCGGVTCAAGQFCQRQYAGIVLPDGGPPGPFTVGCLTPTGPCTPASTCSDRVCFATDPCQSQCADLQISDAGVYLDCMGV